MRLFLCVLVVGLFGSGCGLIDSDITNFDIALPDEELTIDSADWQLSGDETLPAVDCSAMDLCSAKSHIDVFALVSGDSDFSPLVSKLKENDKRVIGCGAKQSTSDLLIATCDEFIYYDDLVREAVPKKKAVAKKAKGTDAKKGEGLEILIEVLDSLARDYDVVWGSMIKQAIRRLHPGFNERYHGYASFSDLLEDAEDQGLIELDFDEERGNYAVRATGGSGKRS